MVKASSNSFNNVLEAFSKEIQKKEQLGEDAAPVRDQYNKVMDQKLEFVEEIKFDPTRTAIEKYKRLAGEVEAREVSIRRNLTPEQRKLVPIYSDGISKEDVIVRFGKPGEGGPLFSRKEPDTIEPVTSPGGKADIPTAKIPRAGGGNPFKNSVVQEPVYHATARTFDRFDPNMAGKSGIPKAGKSKVIYFTDSVENANEYLIRTFDMKAWSDQITEYREKAERLGIEIDRKRLGEKWYQHREKIMEEKGVDSKAARLETDEKFGISQDDIERLKYYKKKASEQLSLSEIARKNRRIVTAWLDIKNPIIYDVKGRVSTNRNTIKALIKRAEESGNDGIILNNVKSFLPDDKPSTHYIVFNPDQIKILPSPTSRAGEPGAQYSAKAEEDTRSEFESLKDDWIGNRDEKFYLHQIEAAEIQNQIKQALGKKKYNSEAKDWGQAIHIYLDLKRNPQHATEFYDQLNPDQQKILNLALRIKKNPGLLAVADRVENEYAILGKIALEKDVIHNVIENYAARTWRSRRKDKAPTDIFKKFNTFSRHALPRVFETILEGQAIRDADGNQVYELLVKDVTENLRVAKDEIHKTIEDKAIVEKMRTTNWLDTEDPMLTHVQLEGYRRVDHPNFVYWHPFGGVKAGHTKDYVITEDGEKIRLGRNARAQIRWAVQKEGNDRATRVFDTEEEAALFHEELQSSNPEDVYRIEERTTLWERRTLYAPEKLAKRLNNMLGTSKLKGVPGIDLLTRVNAFFKAMVLMTGLFHHQAFIRSFWLGSHPGLKGLNIRQAYKKGLDEIMASGSDENHPLRILTRGGLTLGKMQDFGENLFNKENTKLEDLLDKMKVTKVLKDKLYEFMEWQAKGLFERFGGGLKAQAAIIEYTRALDKYGETMNPYEIAKMVAKQVNDDFGGLHLQRMERNLTLQHIFRLVALAPDWTESNVRTALKMIKAGGKGGTAATKEEANFYRWFWARVAAKGLGVTIAANLLMSLWDDDDPVERFKKAWHEGNLRALGIDVTPLYRILGGKDPQKRKYISFVGHFKDPVKFATHPIRSAHHKGSILWGTLFEALAGHDWKGEKFTTMAELLGIDDKGYYLTSGKKHEFGELKGGKLKGQTVSYRAAKSGTIGFEQMPSYLLSQAKGMTPIQVQQILGFLGGEIDGWDALTRSMGMHSISTYPTEKKTFREFVKRYRQVRLGGYSPSKLRKDVQKYNEWARRKEEHSIPWSKIVKRGKKEMKAERVYGEKYAPGLLDYNQ